LESRFITEEMGQYRLRDDIPINLPSTYKEEALHLRNKLLLFRFRNLRKQQAAEALVDRSVEPRLNQIFVPLLSIIEDTGAREGLRDLIRRYNRELIADRGMDMEAHILEVIRDLMESSEDGRIAIKDITGMFAARHEEEYDKKITPKWIGSVIRKRLHLKTQKSHGAFVIAPTEKPKLDRLYERFGIGQKEE